MKKIIYLLLVIILNSCAVHLRSNIQSNEEFIIELKRPHTRGGLVETVIESIFFEATYLADKFSKSLSNTYFQSLSINDYYNTDLGDVEKTYKEIHIKKFSNPNDSAKKEAIITDGASVIEKIAN